MKNAVEKEEALEELGISFENYLTVLRDQDEDIQDDMSRASILSKHEVANRMVSLDPFVVNKQVRRSSVAHVKKLSTAIEMDEEGKKPNLMLYLLVGFFCFAIGCSYVGFVFWKSSYPHSSSTINGLLVRNSHTLKQSKTLSKEVDHQFHNDYVSKKLENLRLTEVLVDRNRRTEMRKVPVLLDITGTGSEYLSPALNKCLGLSSTSDFRELETKNSPHFAVTNKLCGMAKRFKVGKALLMVFMRNPVERVVQEYIALLNEKKTTARNVIAYVNSPSYVDNRQTRILICKPKGELNENDLNTATYVLTNMSVLSMYQDYSNAFRKYRETFSWNSNNTSTISITDSSSQCIEDEFLKSASITAKALEKGLDEKNVVQHVLNKNYFDMKLYFYVKHYTNAV